MIEPFTRFGKWVVLRPAESYRKPSSGKSERKSLCRCDCGTVKSVRDTKLRGGESLCCGCQNFSHGRSGTVEYTVWAGMVGRCKRSRNYADRGIAVCSRWDSFENFFADMGERPTSSHSIDRIDNDGDYSPDNCRWATPSEQQRNKRTNRVIEFRGERRTIAEWSEVTGIKFNTLWWRLDEGWPVERVFS